MSNPIQITLINQIYESFTNNNNVNNMNQNITNPNLNLNSMKSKNKDIVEVVGDRDREENILNAFHFIFYDSSRLMELALDILDKGSIVGYLMKDTYNVNINPNDIHTNTNTHTNTHTHSNVCIIYKIRSNISNQYHATGYNTTMHSCTCQSYIQLINMEMMKMNKLQMNSCACSGSEYYKQKPSNGSNGSSGNNTITTTTTSNTQCVCKHMLAIRLAHCLNRIEYRDVTINQYINM